MINVFTDGYIVTQGFGEENTAPNYLDWYKQNGLKGHEGIDIVPANQVLDWRVFTPITGKVVKVNDKLNNPYGKFVTVWSTKLNIALQFCHLSEVLTYTGAEIIKDTIIGSMGGTGYAEDSYSPHTHINAIPVNNFGFRNGDKKNGYKGMVDPSIYL